MEKGRRNSYENPISLSFEHMQKGEWYSVPTDNVPLLDREANREQYNINGAVIAAFELPSENRDGKKKILHLVDFGLSEQPVAVIAMPDYGELPHLGVTANRFSLHAANFVPDGRMLGISELLPGETVIGRNQDYHANYLIGITGDNEYDKPQNPTISRNHLRFHILDDQTGISIRDESTNGTGILLPSAVGEKGNSGFKRRLRSMLGHQALS